MIGGRLAVAFTICLRANTAARNRKAKHGWSDEDEGGRNRLALKT